MSELSRIGADIELFDRKYRICFTVRAIDLMQEQFGCHIAEILKMLSKDNPETLLNMAYILTVLVNERIQSERAKGSKEKFKELAEILKQIRPDNVVNLWFGIQQSYQNSFVMKDELDISVGEKEDFYNIVRMLTIGRVLGYREDEVWGMTPKYLQILHDDYLEYHGHKKKPVTLDEVIPF